MSRWTRTALLAVAALVAGCAGDDEPTQRGDLLVRADRIFDGTRMIGEGAVLVRGSEIVAVGDLDAEAKRTIDLGDATLMPGVIDLHVHLLGQGMLAGGVTTARDLGAPISVLPQPDVRPGHLRVLAAGPIVTVPGGYPTPVFGSAIALDVRGPADARRAVRMLANRGADVIKISLEPGPGWPMLSTAEVSAIVAEAHARDLTVVAHARGVSGPPIALDGGVDELVHLPCSPTPVRLLRELGRRRIPIVATIHVQGGGGGCTENARAFLRAGGKLLYGSDFGNPGIPPGVDVEELQLMAHVGLSRLEVLRAATSEAGRQVGLEPLGRLVSGAPADLLGVKGDPTRNLATLARPILVVAGGRAVVAEGRIDLPPE